MPQPISLDGLVKRYGQDASLTVLDEVSFSVDGGEFVAIVGPSGCGKTTLLKAIAGIVDYSAGEISVGGTRVTGPSPDITMVFQEFVLLDWKSVLENVALGRTVQTGQSEEQTVEAAREWIEKVGLEEVANRYPAELSGGMKQRVGLARALAVDPDVLLMDEPFGSLDAQTKDRMQTELLQLWNDEQQTILFVTHDVSEAIYLADRVLVMSSKPASITREIDVGFERPRWNRRVEIEGSDEFKRMKRTLREELGLTVQ